MTYEHTPVTLQKNEDDFSLSDFMQIKKSQKKYHPIKYVFFCGSVPTLLGLGNY